MSDPFLGEIKLFAGNFAPRNFALATGQILAISQNTALFSLFGTSYGGNGTSTFALPDLQPAPGVALSSARFEQTSGGRTGIPAPRRVRRAPFVQFSAPLAWTTVALEIHADGTV